MAVIRFRNINKKFVEIPLGGVSDSQIEESVKKYLEENPVEFTETDPTVPDWAKQPSKPTYTAEEVGAYSKEDAKSIHTGLNVRIGTVEQAMDNKASKADLDIGLSRKADKADTYTKTEVDNFIGDIDFALDELHNYAQALIGGASE